MQHPEYAKLGSKVAKNLRDMAKRTENSSTAHTFRNIANHIEQEGLADADDHTHYYVMKMYVIADKMEAAGIPSRTEAGRAIEAHKVAAIVAHAQIREARGIAAQTTY